MNNTSSLFRVLLLPALLLGCNYHRSVSVVDVRKEQVIVLKEAYGLSGDVVYGISIRGSGSIEGQATISLMLNGEPYKTEELKGAVNFKWGGDWYSETAEIRYKPYNVKSGELTIEYRFLS